MTEDLGSRAASRWVAVYTHGLPPAARQARRDELASDLWEHAHHAAQSGRPERRHAVDVFGRVVAGMPADLAWRRDVLHHHRLTPEGVRMRAHRVTSVAYVSILVLACIGMTGALGAVFVLLSGDVTAGAVAWAVACGVLALCLLAGVLTHDRKPVRATVLLVVGSPAIAVAWFWLPPAYLLSVALAVAALMCRPRARVAPAA